MLILIQLRKLEGAGVGEETGVVGVGGYADDRTGGGYGKLKLRRIRA